MMGKHQKKSQAGIALTEALIAIVTFLAIVFIGLAVEHKLNHTNNTANQTANSSNSNSNGSSTEYAILSPATVPSKVPECSQQITFTSGGNSGPITCSNGDLNTTEWNALDTLEPKILTLGYEASPSQVSSALCADVEANVSNPIEVTAYQIASLYYGWDFSSDPSIVIKNGTCKNQDD